MSTIDVERTTQALPGKARARALTKQKLKWMLYAGLAGFLALGAARYGYDWWSVGRFIESTDDAYAGGNVTPISPHVAGFVAQILAGDNEYVRAGQPLIRLDDRDFRAAVDRASAIVTAREAKIASLLARAVLQQTTIRQAKADLDGKTAQAAFAREEDIRYRQLALTSAGSRQNAERASALDEAAQAGVASSEAGLDAAKQQFEVLDADIAEARADSNQAQADLLTAELNLGYTEIRSPIDGYVGNRAAEVGAYVSGGAYLVTIIPAHNLWVDANFKEDQLERMAPGQSATVIADVLPDHIFHGRVISLAPATGAIFSVIPPENATGNFTKIVQRVPVRVKLDGAETMLHALRPGLSATVSVDARSASGTAHDRRAFHGELDEKPLALRGHVRGHVQRAARHPDPCLSETIAIRSATDRPRPFAALPGWYPVRKECAQ
jgi:membrane fusion protein (multidrug efflux system)